MQLYGFTCNNKLLPYIGAVNLACSKYICNKAANGNNKEKDAGKNKEFVRVEEFKTTLYGIIILFFYDKNFPPLMFYIIFFYVDFVNNQRQLKRAELKVCPYSKNSFGRLTAVSQYQGEPSYALLLSA